MCLRRRAERDQAGAGVPRQTVREYLESQVGPAWVGARDGHDSVLAAGVPQLDALGAVGGPDLGGHAVRVRAVDPLVAVHHRKAKPAARLQRELDVVEVRIRRAVASDELH